MRPLGPLIASMGRQEETSGPTLRYPRASTLYGPEWCQEAPGPASTEITIPTIYLQIARKKRADERTRTADLLITSELLYLLSYVGVLRAQSISQGYSGFTWI